MSRFRLFRHLLASAGGATSVTYDTSIGNGVDINGFASLPLYAPGTDGADLATATPTLDSGSVTYNSGTRTLTDTGSGPIARWTGILTPGQSYHIIFNLTVSSFAKLIIQDESANTQWSSPYSGNGTSQTFLIDALFTATGHDLILQRTDDVFTGSIQIVKVAQNTGGLGGRRFYVRPSTGTSTNNGTQAQSPSTPLTTVAQALRFVQSGRGDQILIAQGESLTRGLTNFAGIGGFSATYPLVVQSYDPADATNEAKIGRATGSNRPVISSAGADMSGGLIGNTASAPYIAFRGLKFDAAGAGNVENTVFIAATGTLDYILIENCEWAGAQLSVQGSSSSRTINHVVVRNSSFHGQYDSANRGDAQGAYFAFTNNVTIEDNCFANCGWKEGASYTASYTVGGASIYGHPFYLQDDTRLSTARRNAFIRNANDGGRPKGDCTYYQNLVINSDIGISAGGGNFYSSAAPSGVDMQVSYNAFLGGNQQATASWGIWFSANCKSGSSAHHNLLAQAGQNSYGIQVDAQEGDDGIALDCYGNFYNNVIDAWAYNDGQVVFTGGSTAAGDLSKIHCTTNNNYWDDAASGTNLNISALTRPTRYTVSSLVTALGYADLPTAQAAWLSDPASHGWRTGVKLALVGYGVDISGMPFLS